MRLKHTKCEVILRYTIPTRYDKAPYGVICKVMGESETNYDLYIQVSPDDVEYSEWVKMGDFLEWAFKKELFDKDFIEGCLHLYETN
jgi:hypothetical protein